MELQYISTFNNRFVISNLCISKGTSLNGNTPLHSHEFNELVFFLSGTGIQTINNKRILVSAGDVFVLKGNDTHSIEAQNQMTIFNIGYKSDLLEHYGKSLEDLPGYHALFHIDPVIREFHDFKSRLHLSPSDIVYIMPLLNTLETEFLHYKPGSELLVLSCFLYILTFVSRKYTSVIDSADSANMPALSKALLYIENHLDSELSLEILADLCQMSICNLICSFKKYLHQTPLSYINTLKLKKSCELLVSTSQTITEIAFSCGFSDSNYFCRIFKKHLLMSPTKFRTFNQLPLNK